ncbi:MAG: AAA family ATPase [bacterium]|nr:AAA family ATPase [bacterium]
MGIAERPIFEGLEVPAQPLSPTAAAEGAVAIVTAVAGERDGALSGDQVAKAMNAVTNGDIEAAKALVVRQKVDRPKLEGRLPEELLREREGYDPAALVGELKGAMRRVSRQVIGRETLLVQTLYALLTREHQLIYSRAGTAKSLYATSIFGQFGGARTFTVQMTKGTTEEGLVGAVNIDELKKGNIVHNVEGSIVEARFAFLDEIFDSNDVALRSLLGILNERLFRKGKQYVEAVLHSAIATSNYVRASEITEAVIDRFPFRAYLMPNRDPYDLLRIDDVYGKGAGRAVVPAEDQRIPFEHIEYLADLVEGHVPGREIQAPPHVLFLKNAVILEYMRLINEARKREKKSEVYVSPRTMAKTRDILNASALLRGRTTLETEDLNDLKYMVTTIGDQERQEEYYEQALKNVLTGIKNEDLQAVDTLMEGHALLETIIAAKERGEAIQPKWWERIQVFFGIVSLGELTFGKIRRAIDRLQPQHDNVQELKKSLLARVDREAQRFGGKERGILD